MFMADMLHAYGRTIKLLKRMGRGAKTKQNSCIRQVLRTSFLVTRPRVLLPPGDRYSAQTTENRSYNWAYPMGSPIISSHALSSPTKFPVHFCSACTIKSLLFRSYLVVLSESPSSLFSLDKDCPLNVPLRSLIVICKRLLNNI